MAVPSSKEELIKAINSNFSLLNKKLESITPQLAFEPLLEGHAKGTTISVANLVSYLIGWGELVLHWHDQEAKGKTIIFPEEGFKWNELGRLAQKFYRDYEDITEYEVLLARLKENKQQLVGSSGIKTAKSPACRVMATLFSGDGAINRSGLRSSSFSRAMGRVPALMPSQPVITTCISAHRW